MIKTGDLFIVAYEDNYGTYINLALSDMVEGELEIQQVYPPYDITSTTSLKKEDRYQILDPSELISSLQKLQESNPELFI